VNESNRYDYVKALLDWYQVRTAMHDVLCSRIVIKETSIRFLKKRGQFLLYSTGTVLFFLDYSVVYYLWSSLSLLPLAFLKVKSQGTNANDMRERLHRGMALF